MDLADLDLAAFLAQLTQMARRHGIEIPSSVTTVGRALVTLEGLLDKFIPNVNMIQIISKHIAASKTNMESVTDELKTLAVEGHEALHGALKSMSEANTALHMLTRGELRMNLELVSSEEPMRQLSDMVNRLTMALIVVGLFIGSSIVYYAGMKPIIFGIPAVRSCCPYGSSSTSTRRNGRPNGAPANDARSLTATAPACSRLG